ncbi:CDP-glucose 4,6-dehydratase [Usitatibacter palustris]|uniref:CDP-glucose 4,6-dehydratase n=1 Tax=Usitatibacter palustris TaxID=2732487 RepID=A0A6M4HER1_9PROT|nr:CDP-glucose 4,6-dehydratase [Usitatibacter palustris]QJR16507.1 CDP-glucose 4,6-dehydratase [Usitatibacter palustris]
MLEPSAWRGRRVLVTGHTGFKGGWLSVWLASLGAKVAGYALDPPTVPSFFTAGDVATLLADNRGDIRDAGATRRVIESFDPEVVFHLAAQPLVKEGYREPIETYATNVVGTASVLEACRHAKSVRAIVAITTDKCYENREWDRAYVEGDALGGHDPYSNSKACTELVCDAYRRSFFAERTPHVGLATARAGNVIGGGDWAADRLIPDLVRSANAGAETRIRYPGATRPWQHVIEPLHGYLLLAQRLFEAPGDFSEAWNFGPDPGGDRPVGEVVEKFAKLWPGKVRWSVDDVPHAHEAGKLMLDSTKALERLGWKPRLGLDEALRLTVEWYAAAQGKTQGVLRTLSENQIRSYCAAA